MATNKYFQCPYCNKKYSRDELVIHLGNKHMDELPEGFTPLRAAFHIVNRKDFKYARHCRICKNSTNWDENKGRYDFLCGSKYCHDKYVEIMRENMGEKLGINRQTKTADGLKKMLAGRKISGTYKFQDGTEMTYTGSYERKTLEFFDTVLNVKSSDIVVPGPALSYELDGVKHFYIPDMYYVPYNLIIEVKDGGNRPNNNPQWKETRRKQIAKEKFIIENTEFNYIRLTNNDFSQILSVFADLKMSLKEYDGERVIHVNESLASTMGYIPPLEDNDITVVNYLQNNVFANKEQIAIADNPKFDHLFIWDNITSEIKKVNKNFLSECTYSTYILKDRRSDISTKIAESLNTAVDEDFLYEITFGHKRYSNDQILFENNLIPYEDYYCKLCKISESCKKFIIDGKVEEN